jgi:hypothetical protein
VAHTCNPSYSGRSQFDCQPRQIVRKTVSQKNRKRAAGVAQGEGPEFKPQYLKKKKKKLNLNLKKRKIQIKPT